MDNSFSNWLRVQLRLHDWRAADLAARAGIRDASLSRILGGTRSAGPNVCRGIARAFRMDPVVVFRMAGLLPPSLDDLRNADSGLSEFTALYNELDERDRGAALRMVRGLVEHADSMAPLPVTPDLEPETEDAPSVLDSLTSADRTPVMEAADALFKAATLEEQAYMAEQMTMVVKLRAKRANSEAEKYQVELKDKAWAEDE